MIAVRVGVLAVMAAGASATTTKIAYSDVVEEAGIAMPVHTETDLEDCGAVLGSGFSSARKKRRRAGDSVLTPLELLQSRGRRAVFVTEICSQVVPPHQISFSSPSSHSFS